MASRFQRSALAVALVGFMAAASVLVLRARPEPFGEVPTLPLMGWYVVSHTPATGIEDDAVLLGTAQTWAETARQAGYDDVRVFPQRQSGGSCFTGPDDGSETVEWFCPMATPAVGYVVVLRGPLSPPPTLDSDAEFEWYKQTWEEERQQALSRSFPHEVLLSPLPFPTRIADDTGSVPVIEGATLVDGWYLAVTPGDLTTDDGMALTAARAMAVGAQQAGYDEVRIVHWPQGPGPCDPWGCEDDVPTVVYVVVLGGPYPAPAFANVEEESAWQQQLQTQERAKAQERGMVAAPFVVPLRFSALAGP